MVDKASDETIDKVYVEYKQRKLNLKKWKKGKALEKHVIILYLTGISQLVKIKDVQILQQDIGNDPSIRGQIF